MGIDANQPLNTSANFAERTVACPQCKGESVYHPSNPSRPFCSPRCRAVDLGAWANEDFRVVQNSSPENPDSSGA